MKKHILKVWMILAISFLAMNVAGQVYSPTFGATGVSPSPALSITFEVGDVLTFGVNKNIYLYKYENSDFVFVTSFNTGKVIPPPSPRSPLLGINGEVFSIDLTQMELEPETSYYIYAEEGFISVNGNSFNDLALWSPVWFFTIEPVILAPMASVYTPLMGATSTPIDQDLSLQFDIDIQAGTGNLEIWEVGGISPWAAYDQTNFGTELTIVANNTLNIALPLNFDEGTSYYVLIDPGFVESTESVAFDGFTTNSDWSFTTEYLPLNPPTLNPLDGVNGVPRNAILEVVFDKDIEFGNGGTLEIYNGTSQAKLFNKSSSEISIVNNNTLRVDLSSSALAEYATLYDVRISSDFIKRVGSEVYFTGFAAGEWSFTTEAEPLELTATTPEDGVTGVQLTESLVATFNQNIQLASGAEVSVYAYEGDVLFETLTEVSGLSVVGMELTINPIADFAEGKRYYVIIPDDAVESTTGTPFSGVTLKDDWDFTTTNLPPSVVSYDPDGSSAVAIDEVLNLTFDRPIKLNDFEQNSVRIRQYSDGEIFYTYVIDGVDTDDLLTVSGNVLTITPPVNYESSTQYYVEISNGAILSLADVSFPGISSKDTWKFTTDAAAAAPVIAVDGYSPIPGKTEVSLNPVLELTFTENIVKGNSGYFRIFKSVGGVDDELLAIPRSNGQVSVLNNKLSVTLSNITLEYNTDYYILIDAGFIKSETTGVDFGGIAITTDWYFTTETSPPVWEDDFPSISDQTMTDFVFNSWADVEGTYYVVVTQSSTAPSAEQISQGLNQGGTGARIAFNRFISDENNSLPSSQTVDFNEFTQHDNTFYLHAVYSNGSKYSEIRTLTIDRIVPKLLSSNPSGDLIVFPVDSELSISFSEPVVRSDGDALTGAYFSLVKDGEPVEDVNFGFAVETVSEITTVTLTPTLALDPNTAYTLTINPVYDLNGNMGAETLINFQTDGLSTWTGAVSTAWTDPENWLGDSYVPFKSVLIQSGSTLYPEITTGTVDVHNLTIEPGAALTHTGGTLNVTGLFTLESSVDVNASYINNGAVGTTLNVVGSNVNVEQIISNIDLTYLIAAPTSGSSAANFGNYFPLYTYNNSTDSWDAISSGALMTPGVGYRMWTDDGMVGFSGGINTGAFQVDLTRTDSQGFGWNLVGNPYPASIDWTLLGITESSTIEDHFWIWMPTQKAYGAYSASTDIPINIESSKIPSNHAFLVKVKQGLSTGSIEFIPEAQVANDANYLKSGSTKPVVDYIKLAGVTSNNIKDEMAVAFADEASTGVDRFDMEKRFANRDHLFELFSLAESMKTSINAIPLNGAYEVPLGFNALKTGDFSIEMVTNKADNIETILVDNLEAAEIRLLPGDRYDFSVVAKGLNTSRFSLKFLRVSTEVSDKPISINRTKVYVQDKEVFINLPLEFAGSGYRVLDFSGRLVQTGSLNNEGVNSLGHFVEGSYIINVISKNSTTLENHKVVVY